MLSQRNILFETVVSSKENRIISFLPCFKLFCFKQNVLPFGGGHFLKTWRSGAFEGNFRLCFYLSTKRQLVLPTYSRLCLATATPNFRWIVYGQKSWTSVHRLSETDPCSVNPPITMIMCFLRWAINQTIKPHIRYVANVGKQPTSATMLRTHSIPVSLTSGAATVTMLFWCLRRRPSIVPVFVWSEMLWFHRNPRLSRPRSEQPVS